MENIEKFYLNFMQEILAGSNAKEDYYENVFIERMLDFLVDQGVIENYQIAHFKKTSVGRAGLRIDGYNLNKETGLLSIFILDFRNEKDTWSLTMTDINRLFKYAENFLEKSHSVEFYQSIEESTEGIH